VEGSAHSRAMGSRVRWCLGLSQSLGLSQEELHHLLSLQVHLLLLQQDGLQRLILGWADQVERLVDPPVPLRVKTIASSSK